MFPNSTSKNETLVSESLASWSIYYLTPEGFECQLNITGKSGQEVLDKAPAAIANLIKSGCIPSLSGKSNLTAKSNANVSENAGNNGGNNGNGRDWCPIHHMVMKRWEKDGRVWYSHKVDGQWCSGKAK